ncbi:MAG TPA: hypothetical protein VME01_11590 [Solirubrobacteraceae bacterium]|nr:hypothetical protein [Solirubrobacteraceae bacterium]
MTDPKTDTANGRLDHDLEYHAPSTVNKAMFEVYEASVATGRDGGRFGDLVAKVWTPWGRLGLLLALLIVIVLITRVV